MNEITSKNNTIKTVLIAVLSILLVGSLGFIAYDKLIKKENPITEENNKQDDNKVEENDKQEDNKVNNGLETKIYENVQKYYIENEEDGSKEEITFKDKIVLNNDNTFDIKIQLLNFDIEYSGKYEQKDNKIVFSINSSNASDYYDEGFESVKEKFGINVNSNEELLKQKLEATIKDNKLILNKIEYKEVQGTKIYENVQKYYIKNEEDGSKEEITFTDKIVLNNDNTFNIKIQLLNFDIEYSGKYEQKDNKIIFSINFSNASDYYDEGFESVKEKFGINVNSNEELLKQKLEATIKDNKLILNKIEYKLSK